MSEGLGFALDEALLNALPTNVMVADSKLRIVFMNERALATMSGLGEEVSRAFGLGVDEVLGGSIHRFHKDPARVERILEGLKDQTHTARFRFGSTTLEVEIRRFNEAYMVIWEDVSELTSAKAESEQLMAKLEGEKESLDRQVRSLLNTVERAMQGDFSQRAHLSPSTPVGQVGRGVDTLLEKVEGQISALEASATALEQAQEELSSQTQAVEKEAEQGRMSSEKAVREANEVKGRVSEVRNASGELDVSVREISKSAQEASKVARSAVTATGAARERIHALVSSGLEVTEVVKTIRGIAEQTNLLALNATIEAARAGEMGKGFAVVAAEVKELARETARATEEIDERMTAMATESEGATTAMDTMRDVIDEIEQHQSTIAAAVEEQSATTSEIRRSLEHALGGLSSVAQELEELASVTRRTDEATRSAQAAAASVGGVGSDLNRQLAAFR